MSSIDVNARPSPVILSFDDNLPRVWRTCCMVCCSCSPADFKLSVANMSTPQLFRKRSESDAHHAQTDMDTSLDSMGTSFGLEELRTEIDATSGAMAQPSARAADFAPASGGRMDFLLSKPLMGFDAMFKSPTGTESSVSAIQTLSTGAPHKDRGRTLFNADAESSEDIKILEDLSMSADRSSSLHSSFDSTADVTAGEHVNTSSPPLRASRPKSPMMTPIALRPMPDQVCVHVCV